jgi:hypothetical protein
MMIVMPDNIIAIIIISKTAFFVAKTIFAYDKYAKYSYKEVGTSLVISPMNAYVKKSTVNLKVISKILKIW